MSSRQARKLLKEQQEKKVQEEANKVLQKNEEEDDDEEEEAPKQKKAGFFDLMSNSSDQDSDDDDEEKSGDEEEEEETEEEKAERLKQEEEEKRKREEEQKRIDEELERKRKLKEEKANKKKSKQENDEIELDQILKRVEEEEKKQNFQDEEQKQNGDFNRVNELELESTLQIIKAKLNYNKELSKYFKGAKLTDNKKVDENEEIQQLGLRNKRLARMYLNSQKKKIKSIKQLNLVHDDKPRQPMPEKFICEFVGENKLGQRLYAFKPTPKYESLQQVYLSVQNQMDPQAVFDFVTQNPYHADGLYNLFEFYRLQGKFKEANAMLEQILYIYEDCFGFEFSQIFDDKKNRFCLSVENNKYGATFFAALLKFVDLLGKKGCYRAALEYNKVLLKMNPESDPAGALLCLDYNSLSCKAYDYLIYFVKNFAYELYQNPKYSIQYMPNFIYSSALAKFSKVMLPPLSKNKQEVEPPAIGTMIDFKEEDFDKAVDFNRNHIDDSHNVQILTAILLYPKLIKNMCLINEFHKAPLGHSLLKDWQKKSLKDILEHKLFSDETAQPYYSFLGLQNNQDIEGLNKLFEIYVERSKIVWKDNKIMLWIKAATGFILNMFEKKSFDYDEFVQNLCLGSEKNILPFSLNRYRILQKANFSDHIERLDLNNIQDNVNMEAANDPVQNPNYNPINTNQSFFSLLAQSLLPWVHLPGQNNNENNNNNNNAENMNMPDLNNLNEQQLMELMQQAQYLDEEDDDDDYEDEDQAN
ncbi:hypothetical protein ABPG74_001551 [Tetrahymena malaccensis]